jgi:hypothetical protein
MLRRVIRFPKAFAVLVCLALPSEAMSAQSAPVQVAMSFKVPVTLRNIHPEITRISVSCSASIYTTTTSGSFAGGGQTSKLLSAMQRAADGSYSGEFNVAFTATVPADASGKRGQYGCRTEGCLSSGSLQYYGGSCGPFSTGHPEEPRLRVLAPAPGVSSVEFIW